MPRLPQQNVNHVVVASQMQNLNVPRNVANIDPETTERRKYMLDRIFNFLMQRRQQSRNTPSSRRVIHIVKCLEHGLFKSASTMEEYLDLETLERRLLVLIQRVPTRNRNQQSNAIASSTVNSGSFFPTRNGTVAGGYQESSNAFLNNPVGNNMTTSMGVPRMTSQVIPTPGINNSNINSMNSSTSNNKSEN